MVITYLHRTSLTEGWAIGGDGDLSDRILRTDDGGDTWQDVTPPEPEATSDEPPKSASAYFLNSDLAWVTYTGQTTVWATSDAGASWQSGQTKYPGTLASMISFADPTHGWLMRSLELGVGHEYVSLSRTTNGGVTWEGLVDPYTSADLQSCGKTAMVFFDERTGWVTYDCGGLYAIPFLDWTVDGGSTWHTVELPPPAGKPDLFDASLACDTDGPALFSPISGALVVTCRRSGEPAESDVFLYTTRDQGLNWLASPYPGGRLHMFNVDEGLALGREIYRTRDGGKSWTKIKTVEWDGQFSFVDDTAGWAVARSGDEIALVATTDGGRSWRQLAPIVAAPPARAVTPESSVTPSARITPGPIGGGSGQIAFLSFRDSPDGRTNDIYLLDLDSSQVVRITDGSSLISNFSWSPDGNRIAFASDRYGDSEIYLISADGSGWTQLTNNSAWDDEPAWSPDGRSIAYASEGGIDVIAPDGGQARRLVSMDARTPAWSPTGTQIAFAVFFDGIYVMNADGSGLERITDSREHGYDWYPEWSPDGRSILFGSSRQSPGNAATEQVYVMNADGTNIQYIGDQYWGQPPYAWSPDGTLIAYVHDFYSSATLYLMNASGSEPRPLMVDNEGFHPAWRP